jgi:hypothetical protein
MTAMRLRAGPVALVAPLLLPLLLATPAAAQPQPRPDDRERRLEGWWERQREREAQDRFWNGPREQRRNLTRDQIERWEYQRNRRTGRPSWPF